MINIVCNDNEIWLFTSDEYREAANLELQLNVIKQGFARKVSKGCYSQA